MQRGDFGELSSLVDWGKQSKHPAFSSDQQPPLKSSFSLEKIKFVSFEEIS
jgi:hypothetical protein